MSRRTISDQIMEWNAGALPDAPGSAGPLAWREVRLNLLLLLALTAVVDRAARGGHATLLAIRETIRQVR
jgi:hypothetical protein